MTVERRGLESQLRIGPYANHVTPISGAFTRRDGGFVLACWDCSRKKIEELGLKILPGLGKSRFDAPDGFLFVGWEESSSAKVAS